MINFAHSEVLMLGAFMALGLAALLPAVFGTGLVGLAGMFVLSMAGAGLINVIIERFAYRPLRHISRLAPLISAIGVSIILQNGVFIWISTQSLRFPEPVAIDQVSVFGATISSLQIIILAAALILMGLLHFFVEHTKLGKAMRACSDDIQTAGLMGINPDYIIALTFFVGGALGGAAGVLYGMNYGSIKYNLGFLPGAKAFTAAVLGGIGNIPGAMLGGVVLGIVEALGAGYIGDLTDLCRYGPLARAIGEHCADGGHFVLFGSNYQDVFAFVVLILVLVLRPSGLLGERVGERA